MPRLAGPAGSAHWGIPDPAAVEGTDAEKMQAFREALRMLSNRIGVFIELPFDKLDRIQVEKPALTTSAARPAEGTSMSRFERYLTVWVALCIAAGVALGISFRPCFTSSARPRSPRSNLPVAALIWLRSFPCW